MTATKVLAIYLAADSVTFCVGDGAVGQHLHIGCRLVGANGWSKGTARPAASPVAGHPGHTGRGAVRVWGPALGETVTARLPALVLGLMRTTLAFTAWVMPSTVICAVCPMRTATDSAGVTVASSSRRARSTISTMRASTETRSPGCARRWDTNPARGAQVGVVQRLAGNVGASQGSAVAGLCTQARLAAEVSSAGCRDEPLLDQGLVVVKGPLRNFHLRPWRRLPAVGPAAGARHIRWGRSGPATRQLEPCHPRAPPDPAIPRRHARLTTAERTALMVPVNASDWFRSWVFAVHRSDVCNSMTICCWRCVCSCNCACWALRWESARKAT